MQCKRLRASGTAATTTVTATATTAAPTSFGTSGAATAPIGGRSSNSVFGHKALTSSSAVAGGGGGGGTNPSDDLMKPVRDLLAAQANKDRAQQQRLATAAGDGSSGQKAVNTAQSMVIGTDAHGKALVHRDVFASTADKVVKAGTVAGSNRLGDTFGMHGAYDLYPETAEYEVRDAICCCC